MIDLYEIPSGADLAKLRDGEQLLLEDDDWAKSEANKARMAMAMYHEMYCGTSTEYTPMCSGGRCTDVRVDQ